MRGRLDIPKDMWTYSGPAVAANASSDIVLFVQLRALTEKIIQSFPVAHIGSGRIRKRFLGFQIRHHH
jgi:hypothetical protein